MFYTILFSFLLLLIVMMMVIKEVMDTSSHHTSHSVSSMRKTNQIRIVPKVIISSIVFHRFMITPIIIILRNI